MARTTLKQEFSGVLSPFLGLFLLGAFLWVIGLPSIALWIFTLFVLGLLLLGYYAVRHGVLSVADRALLHVMPTIPPAVAASPYSFDTEKLPPPTNAPPELPSGLFKMGSNERAIQAHLELLADQQEMIGNVLSHSFTAYREGVKRLTAQQEAAVRMAAIATRLVTKINPRLPASKVGFDAIPDAPVIKPLALPVVRDPKAYTKTAKRIGQAHMPASAGMGAQLLMIAAKSVLLYREYQKLIREMHASDLEVSQYRARASREMELMRTTYAQIVALSDVLDGLCHEMEDIIPLAKALAGDVKVRPSDAQAAQIRLLERMALYSARIRISQAV